MIGIRHYRAFIAVAEELHFGRAAEKLGIAQPAVSRDILALEKYLRSNLLRRSSRKVELTELGKRYYARIAQALQQMDSATRLARLEAAGEAGALRISYMDFSMHGPMVALVRDFRRRCPNVTVELVNSYTDQTIEWLTSMRVDLGIVVGDVDSSLLNHRTLTRERLVLVMQQGHRLSSKTEVSFADLEKEVFILGSRKYWRKFRQTIDAACTAYGFSPTVSQEASSSDVIFGLVETGAGVTFYPEGIGDRLSKGLTMRLVAGSLPRITTTLVWHSENASGPMGRFLEIVNRRNGALEAQ